ncbi:hypothetical protein L1887_58588 [Cichorium endivia]|nr:hypothetical protein L1887_58588 [Cichorium endivia]
MSCRLRPIAFPRPHSIFQRYPPSIRFKMVALIQATRYPSASAQDPMVNIARAIMSAVPRTAVDEKLQTVKTAAEKVRSYGAIATRTRENRLAELKNSISRPISLPNTQSPTVSSASSSYAAESMDSRWSTQSWPCETTPLVERSSAFEFDEQLHDDARNSTCSQGSFVTRPYSFF